MRKVLLVNDTRIVGHHGSSAVVDVIMQELGRRGIAVVSDLQQGIDIASLADHGCQAVVINGEGAMHSGQKNSHLFSRIGQQMSERGIPVFLINTVFDERTPEIVARMRHFSGIYCRETPSAERLAASGVPAEVCPDLTYALSLPEALRWQPGESIVVLDTTVGAKNRTLHRFCREHNLRFQTMRYAPQLIRLSSKNLIRIARFNVTSTLGKVLQGSYALNRYANAVSDRQAFVRRIAHGTRVVIAARFHGVCLCMKVGVPFLAIASNTPKIEGMLADAGLGHRMLNMTDLNLKEIQKRCAWSTSDEEKRTRYVDDAKARITRMFDAIAATVQ